MLGGGAGSIIVVFGEVFAELAGEAAGKADEAFGMLGQKFFADARLAIEAVQRGLRGDADQVAIALVVFRDYEQVMVLVALRVGAMILLLADVELTA